VTDLLASVDVLDGDELAVGAVAHEARDAEVAGADVADKLVAVAVVHYGHVHPRVSAARSIAVASLSLSLSRRRASQSSSW
jgi:4-aminobutyrate aminotransferase-like enzyme